MSGAVDDLAVAARAELRSRDLRLALVKTRDFAQQLITASKFSENGQANSCIAADYGRELALMARPALTNDSEERLRELLRRALYVNPVHPEFDEQSALDELLRGVR